MPGLGILICSLTPVLGSCAGEPGDRALAVESPRAAFVEVAAEVGIDFRHRSGASGRFYFPEPMQAGAAFVDFDNDSHLDVYLVQSGSLPAAGDEAAANRLFRNLGDGRFEEVADAAGAGDRGYGVGVAVGDYDGDGWVDLYVTNLGRNRLYRNIGPGADGRVRFSDVTQVAGVGDPGYSSSAIFVDYDGDGDLDLWVCNYVEWSPTVDTPCRGPNGLAGYCRPGTYRPLSDTLYRNDGAAADGRVTFTDVSVAAGIAADAASGLGVVAADFDGDHRVDIYVANDQMANQLWINQGDGTFVDEALASGSALNGLGQTEAGMGVASADYDSDGDWDLFATHLTGETNTFYRNEGTFFRDVTDELGLGFPSRPYTGFGTAFLDYDNDGVLDLFVANGKVNPGTSLELDFREPNQLLRGLGDGTFEEVEDPGTAFDLLEVSRAAAFGDYDKDGDVDILVANNDGPARLLRNEVGSRRHWLVVGLVGSPRFDRDAIGALVTVEVGEQRQVRLVQPGLGYTSSSDPRVYFGLGAASSVDRLVVVWPDGSEQVLEDVAANQFMEVEWP